MSRTIPKCDPWVSYTQTVNDAVGCQADGRKRWMRHNGNPRMARSCTFDRIIGDNDGHEEHRFRALTGATRPGVDPLPHHYQFEQNWKVVRPHICDHERVFSKQTKPLQHYDTEPKTSYMSLPGMSSNEDHPYLPLPEVPKPEDPRHIKELMKERESLIAEIQKTDRSLACTPHLGPRTPLKQGPSRTPIGPRTPLKEAPNIMTELSKERQNRAPSELGGYTRKEPRHTLGPNAPFFTFGSRGFRGSAPPRSQTSMA